MSAEMMIFGPLAVFAVLLAAGFELARLWNDGRNPK